MKAVFIVYGQSLTESIEKILDTQDIRGFSRWDEVHGRGSKNGEPHYGTHAWPSKNGAILTIIDEQKVDELLDVLHRLNEQAEQQGLNAYVWNIEQKL